MKLIDLACPINFVLHFFAETILNHINMDYSIVKYEIDVGYPDFRAGFLAFLLAFIGRVWV